MLLAEAMSVVVLQRTGRRRRSLGSEKHSEYGSYSYVVNNHSTYLAYPACKLQICPGIRLRDTQFVLKFRGDVPLNVMQKHRNRRRGHFNCMHVSLLRGIKIN